MHFNASAHSHDSMVLNNNLTGVPNRCFLISVILSRDKDGDGFVETTFGQTIIIVCIEVDITQLIFEHITQTYNFD